MGLPYGIVSIPIGFSIELRQLSPGSRVRELSGFNPYRVFH